MEEEKLFFVKNDNAIYCGDNLEIMKQFPPKCIDLIYIDPPFFSGKNYDITFKDPIAVKEYGLEKSTRNGYKAIAFKDMFDGKLYNYLTFMNKRIKQIYRVLDSKGSFYLHCDWHAGHYLKMLCDKIFGKKNFRNEIIWNYRWASTTKKNWSKKHDTIFFYSKGSKWTFNTDDVRDPYNPNLLKTYKKDEKGLYSISKGKKYYANPLGQTPSDVWNMSIIGRNSRERLGYPTQKPEKLLERIIKASSNPGDIVADFFCGCGTTLAVAKKLGRHFIGVDKSPTACLVMAKRVEYKDEIYGLKNTIIQMKDDLDWKTFQIWAVMAVGGNPHSRKQEIGKLEKDKDKKSLDGMVKAIKTNFNEDVPIEVKKHKGKIQLSSINNFGMKIWIRKLHNGIFISMSKPAKGAIEIMEQLKKRGINILFITFDDLISPNLKSKLKEYGIFKKKEDRVADLRDFVK